MRIAILIETREWGGAEGHTVALARHLAARGHHVGIGLIGTRVAAQFATAAGAEVEIMALPEAAGFRTWCATLKDLRADIGVFAKNWLHAGSPGLELAARWTFPTYVTIEHLTPPPPPTRSHGSHLGGLLPGVGLWWYREMGLVRLRGRCPHRIFTVSDAVGLALIRDYGFPAKRMTTIHNGVDGQRFRPSQAARDTTREHWGIPANATVFGTVGRLAIAHKGLDLAIDAFERLVAEQTDRNVWLVMVGDGPDRPVLERRAASSKAAGQIRFAGPSATPEQVYPAIDVLLMPSRFEGLPLSLMEAMASGCRPIATNVSGIPEIITSSMFGWLVEPEDTGGLSSAMQTALSQPDAERETMIHHCRTRVLEAFAADRQFARLADSITNVPAGEATSA